MDTKVVLDSKNLTRTISRITNQIIEDNSGVNNLVILGLRTRGINLARRIMDKITDIEKTAPPFGTLDITLYRDDFRRKAEWPKVRKTDIKFPIDQKNVILVDDVIFTGRTTRAAIDAVMDYGRPSSIKLAVLVDRGGRELPIQPNYVGIEVQTDNSEIVRVNFKELDDIDQVVVSRREDE